MSAYPALPAPREDPQMVLEAALRELAPAWRVVTWPVSAPDGREEWRVILRHRISGHLKLLGGLGDQDGGRPRGLAAWVVEAYRLGNPEPLSRYLQDVGVATGPRGVGTGMRRPAVVPAPLALPSEQPEVQPRADQRADVRLARMLRVMLRAVRRELTFWRLRVYNHARSQG